MPALNSIFRVAAKPFPRMISPQAQSVVDYAIAGSFLAAAGWFWARNKRAAIASLLCGGAKLAVAMVTDHPGGLGRFINFPARREIDLGLAAMVATMPKFLAFKDEPERMFFMAEGALITLTGELTRFPERPGGAKERTRAA